MSIVEMKKRAFEGADPWIRNKVLHMQRFHVDAHVNPVTGAARPDWKEEADKATEKAAVVRQVATHMSRIFSRRERDGEFIPSATIPYPRRPLTEADHDRRAAALAASA